MSVSNERLLEFTFESSEKLRDAFIRQDPQARARTPTDRRTHARTDVLSEYMQSDCNQPPPSLSAPPPSLSAPPPPPFRTRPPKSLSSLCPLFF